MRWRRMAPALIMNNSATNISIFNLVLTFIPTVVVIIIYMRWSMKVGTLVYAMFRMVVQLILVGYALIVIFDQSDPYVSGAVLLIMLIFAGWIALRPVAHLRRKYYFKALAALVLGGVPVLVLVIFGVVQLKPWYLPRYLIPLAGMIFANSMNAVSLCAERLFAEMDNQKTFVEARHISYRAALIPLLNSFFAVGLVSIPGMMTGQILAGVSPLLAVRYQIMVMAMLLGSCGISAAIFLAFMRKEFN